MQILIPNNLYRRLMECLFDQNEQGLEQVIYELEQLEGYEESTHLDVIKRYTEWVTTKRAQEATF